MKINYFFHRKKLIQTIKSVEEKLSIGQKNPAMDGVYSQSF